MEKYIQLGNTSVDIKALASMGKDAFYSFLKGRIDVDINELWNKYGNGSIEVIKENAEVRNISKKNKRGK